MYTRIISNVYFPQPVGFIFQPPHNRQYDSSIRTLHLCFEIVFPHGCNPSHIPEQITETPPHPNLEITNTHGYTVILKQTASTFMQCAFRQVHSLKFVDVVMCFINKGRPDGWLQISMTASIHSIPNHALVRNMRGWYAILLTSYVQIPCVWCFEYATKLPIWRPEEQNTLPLFQRSSVLRCLSLVMCHVLHCWKPSGFKRRNVKLGHIHSDTKSSLPPKKGEKFFFPPRLEVQQQKYLCQ